MGLGSEHTLALPLWTTNKPCELFNAVVNEEIDCFVICLHGVFSLCATCLWGEVLSWEASLNGCLGHGHGHNPRVQHISRTSCLSPLFSVPSRLVAWQSLDVTAQCTCSKIVWQTWWFSICYCSISRMSRCIKLLPGSCIPPASMVHSLLLISISIARISCNRKSR